MEKKILELFEYRKLPTLLAYGPYDQDSPLVQKLISLQIAIYHLDSYLESNWKTKKSELKSYWKEIRRTLTDLAVPKTKHDDYLSHIQKYQQHELAMRAGKFPTEYKLEYYYFYKSCDVKLLRRIIYDYLPELNKNIPLSDWRQFDLITEINDDIEDVYEDIDVINGNYFQIELVQKGKSFVKEKFKTYIEETIVKSETRSKKKETLHQTKLNNWTKSYGKKTIKLLNDRIKNIDLEAIQPQKLKIN